MEYAGLVEDSSTCVVVVVVVVVILIFVIVKLVVGVNVVDVVVVISVPSSNWNAGFSTALTNNDDRVSSRLYPALSRLLTHDIEESSTPKKRQHRTPS